MQIFSDFFENMKIKKKWKMDLYDGILDFEERSPVRSPFYGSLDPWFFLWFFGKVSEQSDQVAWKPDFRLRTANNDPKQKDESYED